MPDRRVSYRAVVAVRVSLLLLIVHLLQACETTHVTEVEIDAVEVVPASITLLEGDRETVSVVVREASGDAISGGRVTWTIDDPEVATVTSEGIVEAVYPGSTLVRASLGNASGTAQLTVLRGPTLELSTNTVSFQSTTRETETHVAEIDVENAGAGVLEGLDVRVEDSGGAAVSWISTELLDTTAPTRLRVRADPSGLEPGTREAVVTVTSSTAKDPAHIQVSLRIRDEDEDQDEGPDEGPACRITSRTVAGDLRIPANTACVLHDVHVTGHLRLEAGASVIGTDVSVAGNVEGKRADDLTLTDGLIFGDLKLEDGGSTTLRESHVGGTVELKSNVGSIELRDNTIAKDVKLERNRVGPFRVVGNTVDGKLECKDNDPPPSATGNVVEQTTEQCSGP